MELRPDQKARVEELLRTKGVTCPQCGSDALASTGLAYVTMNHRTSVQYGCTNREVEHPDPTGFGPWSLSLDPHEARRIGLGLG
jgi:hypothetical protein